MRKSTAPFLLLCALACVAAAMPGCRSSDSNAPLAAGKWEGLVTNSAFWVRVSFEVDASLKTVSNIVCRLGFKGEDHVFAEWEPKGVAVAVDDERSFRHEDGYGNTLQGKFKSGRSAGGTFDGFNNVTDDKERKPPTEWKAEPVK